MPRDEFTQSTKAAMAKRSAFLCAICKSLTVGPSAENQFSVTNIGVAAHITAASKGGPRYDPSMTSEQRSSINNGIWLCHNHGASVDRDTVTWPSEKLLEIKTQHEKHVYANLGIPPTTASDLHFPCVDPLSLEPREYAFISVSEMLAPYKELLTPILQDKNLYENSKLGILMCGSSPETAEQATAKTPWTIFTNSDWLQWYVDGKNAGFSVVSEISPNVIFGCIPAWPDSFFEFLKAIVLTNTTFEWQRHEHGYLVLSQANVRE